MDTTDDVMLAYKKGERNFRTGHEGSEEEEEEEKTCSSTLSLTFWRQNYFFNFSTPCI